MRHYEILGNYCIPYFEHLDNCPGKTLVNFPKEEIITINRKYSLERLNEISNNEYFDCLNRLFEYTKRNLTTKAVAKYVLDKLKNIK